MQVFDTLRWPSCKSTWLRGLTLFLFNVSGKWLVRGMAQPHQTSLKNKMKNQRRVFPDTSNWTDEMVSPWALKFFLFKTIFLYFPENLRLSWVEIQVPCYCNELHRVFSIFAVGDFIVMNAPFGIPVPVCNSFRPFLSKGRCKGSHRPSRKQEDILCCVSHSLWAGHLPLSILCMLSCFNGWLEDRVLLSFLWQWDWLMKKG